jgi:mannose-6-phosphate isomerase class I
MTFRSALLAGGAGPADVLFEEPGRRFRVVRQNLESRAESALEAGQTLLAVLDGQVSVTESGAETTTVETGETAFVDNGVACRIQAARPARILACTVRRP